MKKTIWIINEYAGSPYHGVELRHYYLGKELIKRGYKVYIITASYSHLFINPPKICDKFYFENIDGINYIWTKVPIYKHSQDKKRVLKWFVFTYKILFNLPVDKMDKPDVILVSSTVPFPIIAGYKWAKYFNSKLIYEVKDIWPLTLVELGNYSSYHPFIKFMEIFEKFAYKVSEKVVSVLPLAYKHMQKQGMKLEKFVYIPNGIYIEDLKNIENEDISDLLSFIPRNKFIVAYAGNFGVANALSTLIESARLLKNKEDIHFILIGKGSEEEKLKKFVEIYKLKNVTFLPYQPRRKVLKFLKECVNICYKGSPKLNIYRFGISPRKIFEYMFIEKPIVHSYSGNCDLVKLANCGVSVEAENPKEVAKAILKLYSLPKDKLLEMGRNGKQYLLKYHTYKVITDKFEKEILR